MNERIRELLKQSELHPYYDAQEEQIEKFSKLIIRDVCNKVEPELGKELLEFYGINDGSPTTD